mgnify:CR=1 FL=1
MPANLLVLGNGRVGGAMFEEAKARKYNVYLWVPHHRIDTASSLESAAHELSRFVTELACDNLVVVNTIGLAELEVCESNPELAFLVNGKLPSWLGRRLKEAVGAGISYIHLSTDMVYSLEESSKASETTLPVLLNNYAKTKYAGDCIILEEKLGLVVRANFLFSSTAKHRPSFVDYILQESRDTGIVRVADATFSPVALGALFELIDGGLQQNLKKLNLLNLAGPTVTKELLVKLLVDRFSPQDCLPKIVLTRSSSKPLNMSLRSTHQCPPHWSSMDWNLAELKNSLDVCKGSEYWATQRPFEC